MFVDSRGALELGMDHGHEGPSRPDGVWSGSGRTGSLEERNYKWVGTCVLVDEVTGVSRWCVEKTMTPERPKVEGDSSRIRD